jgi:hypothetical protein
MCPSRRPFDPLAKIVVEFTNVVTGGGIWQPIRNTSSGAAVNFGLLEDVYGFASYEWPAVGRPTVAGMG